MRRILLAPNLITFVISVLVFFTPAYAETSSVSVSNLSSPRQNTFDFDDAFDEELTHWDMQKKIKEADKEVEEKTASWVQQPVMNQKEIQIIAGSSQVLRFERVLKRIALSDPEIADVVVLGANEILMTTKKRGTTNLIIWDAEDAIYNYRLTVMGDPSTLKAALSSLSPGDNLEVFPTQKGFVVKGNVGTVENQKKIDAAAKAFSDESVSLVSVQNAKQVLLEIRFVEIGKDDDFQFGIDGHYIGEKFGMAFLGGSTGASLAGDAVSTGVLSVLREPSFAFPGLDGTSASPLIAGGLTDQGNRVNYFIKALEQVTDARVIARPNLLVRDGQQASFLVGGEFPVPVITDNTQNIQYREFGTKLTYTPEILEHQIIRLTIDTEVSQLDFANGVTLNNFLVPAVSARRTATNVELKSGHSLIIGGLIQQRKSEIESGTPFLRRIPLLGRLFESTTIDYNNTELIVIVTPKIIDPEVDQFKIEDLEKGSNKDSAVNMRLYRREDDPEVSLIDVLHPPKQAPIVEDAEIEPVAQTEEVFMQSEQKNVQDDGYIQPNYEGVEWQVAESRPLEIAVVEKHTPRDGDIDFTQLRYDLAMIDTKIKELFEG